MIWKARLVILPLALVAAGVGAYALDREKGDNLSSLPSAGANRQFVVWSAIRVIDGDTIAIGREHVRISDLDAPEMPGRARCQHEATLAVEAKAKLSAILSTPGADIRLIRDTVRPLDRYGRTLGRITVNGQDVAEPMIAAGVAKPWRGRSSQWCGL